jgi:hypothetical protein
MLENFHLSKISRVKAKEKQQNRLPELTSAVERDPINKQTFYL